MTRRFSSIVFASLLPVLLSGCLGKILGGGKPVQLYRLDGAARSPAGRVVATPAVARTVLLMPLRFDPAIDGDRMLATRGSGTFYIAGARWVSPMPVMFEQALRAAVHQRSPEIALADQRDGLAAGQALRITIARLEARYGTDGAAPSIVLDGEAQLIDLKTRAPIARIDIATRRQAASNEIAAVVAAFDGATSAAADATAAWLAS